jgi:hypothetical protein
MTAGGELNEFEMCKHLRIQCLYSHGSLLQFTSLSSHFFRLYADGSSCRDWIQINIDFVYSSKVDAVSNHRNKKGYRDMEAELRAL